ncbi:hypothetical protein G6F70_004770 [Rhizopus microsporus]|uniref:Coth-domain-containing protein n=2 Tax=Rhizopus TaxID=4842 RepID=A0A0A1NKR9_RHIZD|nr:hypothetical protein G6F71_004819 [Rhizopus microsporus]KAG1199601.1 hypothetical protein G6F70_004770 [Rhizopus microsporus]KAG1208500.1 hypothetical protein G6F69_007160 [Rhizopus microsporus]KAG1229808.1 hypothetical protein G6F67_006891 [Rhizopus microsporus]KAG1265362.1 hypothetical protein G6F68_003629 [Rhizopus microsporus]
MNLKYLALLISTLTFVNAQGESANKHIKYNVIGLLNSSQSMGVIVDNVTYPLELSSPSTILYTGNAPVARQGYRYTKIIKVDNSTISEPFFRLPIETNTLNEFFNRTWNKKQIVSLPTVYKPLSAIHRISSNLHREGEIPTIHVIANESEIAAMHNNYTQDIEVKASLSYASLNDSLTFKNVGFSISGVSSRWMPKASYNIKLNKEDTIYGYRRIKLRAMALDPSYIHEKVAYGMVNSLGLISTDFSYCRVFLNNQEIGLFGLIETFQDPWTANVFANGNKDYKSGNLYQGAGPGNNTGGLVYVSNLTAYGDGQYKTKAGNKEDYAPLQELSKFIADVPVSGPDAVAIWKSKLDMDSVIRAMALEILNGYYDGYIYNANNYYVYQDPSSSKYIYIPSDLDLTLGSATGDIKPFITGNYSTYPEIYNRPLSNKMLQVPEFKQQFEETLINVTKLLVNPVATNDFINSVVEMIQEDVAWDAQVPRVGRAFADALAALNISAANGRVPQDLDMDMFLRAVASATVVDKNRMNFSYVLKDPAAFNQTRDLLTVIAKGLPLSQAVNGPTNNNAFMGVKDFINTISQNIAKFYNFTLK